MKVRGEDIRSYGPGKFSTKLDSYVYQASLDGVDDEIGSVEELGWYGVIWGLGKEGANDVDEIAQKEHGEPLTKDEFDLLASAAAMIISEDSQGFVNVQYFDTRGEGDEAWEAIQKEYEEYYEGEPEEEEMEENPRRKVHGPGRSQMESRTERMIASLISQIQSIGQELEDNFEAGEFGDVAADASTLEDFAKRLYDLLEKLED